MKTVIDINEFGLERVEAIAKDLGFFTHCDNSKEFFSSKYAVVSCGDLSYDAGQTVVAALARLDFCGFNVKNYVRITKDLGDDILPSSTLVNASASSASDKLYSVPAFMTSKAYGDAEPELITDVKLKQVILIPEFCRSNEFTSLGADVDNLLKVRDLLNEFFSAIGVSVEVKMLNIPDARDQSGLSRFFGMYMTNASRSRDKLTINQIAGVSFASEEFAAALRGDLADYSIIRKVRENAKTSKRSLDDLFSAESAKEVIRNIITKTVEGRLFAKRFSAPKVDCFVKNSPQLYDTYLGVNRYLLSDDLLKKSVDTLFDSVYLANFSGTKVTRLCFLNKLVEVIEDDKLSEVRKDIARKLCSDYTSEARTEPRKLKLNLKQRTK